MLENIDLRQLLVIDIETVPQYSSFEEVPCHYQNLWEHKTRFHRKDGETPADFYSRSGVWAEFGKIICISAGRFSIQNEQISLRVKSFYGDIEHSILNAVASTLQTLPEETTLCAHNGKEFDYPYICRRMLINGIRIPTQLNIQGKKPWEINHLDTMDLWKFGDHKNYTSLNLLAEVFNIPSPKDDIDGTQVNTVYWKEKNLERIRRYCEKDIITTAQLLLKFKSLPLLDPELITLVDK